MGKWMRLASLRFGYKLNTSSILKTLWWSDLAYSVTPVELLTIISESYILLYLKGHPVHTTMETIQPDIFRCDSLALISRQYAVDSYHQMKATIPVLLMISLSLLSLLQAKAQNKRQFSFYCTYKRFPQCLLILHTKLHLQYNLVISEWVNWFKNAACLYTNKHLSCLCGSSLRRVVWARQESSGFFSQIYLECLSKNSIFHKNIRFHKIKQILELKPMMEWDVSTSDKGTHNWTVCAM